MEVVQATENQSMLFVRVPSLSDRRLARTLIQVALRHLLREHPRNAMPMTIAMIGFAQHRSIALDAFTKPTEE